jgi:hypothetical protein
LEDLKNNCLSPPVSENLFDCWVNSNPRKIFNFWKFYSIGFVPSDKLKEFIKKKALEIFGSDYGLNESTSRTYVKLAIENSNKQKFNDSIKELMGEDFCKKYFE